MDAADEEGAMNIVMANMKRKKEERRLEKIAAMVAEAQNEGKEDAELDMAAITQEGLERLTRGDVSLPDEKKREEAKKETRKLKEEDLKKMLLDATRSNAEKDSAIASLRTTAYFSIVGLITLTLIQGMMAAAAVAIVHTNMKLNRVTDEKKEVQKINCTPKLRM